MVVKYSYAILPLSIQKRESSWDVSIKNFLKFDYIYRKYYQHLYLYISLNENRFNDLSSDTNYVNINIFFYIFGQS